MKRIALLATLLATSVATQAAVGAVVVMARPAIVARPATVSRPAVAPRPAVTQARPTTANETTHTSSPTIFPVWMHGFSNDARCTDEDRRKANREDCRP